MSRALHAGNLGSNPSKIGIFPLYTLNVRGQILPREETGPEKISSLQ